jgi:predicted transcriptional regulator of viral defense system
MYPTKTLGPQTAKLFSSIHDTGKTVFTLAAAASMMGVSHRQAASILHAATKRGLITPVKRGLYNLIPFELGSATFHLDNRYALIRESLGDRPYFFSYASALDLHNLATQPSFDVYVTYSVRRKKMNIGGSTTHIVWMPPSRFFGWQELQAGGVHLMVSDLERTLVDAVAIPGYCGGFIEAAKAYFSAKSKVDSGKLIEYARRYKKWSVLRRAGYLLEFFNIASQPTLDQLAETLPPGYSRLDPDLPKEASNNAKWGLMLNISPEELLNAVSH